MSVATLTEKGQVVIPAEIRARYELTPGTQVEFVDDGNVVRLVIRRRISPSDPEAGFGLVKVEPGAAGRPKRRLSSFDPASLLQRQRLPK